MVTFDTDQAIRGDEKTPDLLQRRDFARRLIPALLLETDSPCLVVSIEGPWGYGKTSLINLIDAEFDKIEGENPIVFRFNPWMIGTTESLVQDFLIQFASAIGIVDGGKALSNVAEKLLSYSSILSIGKFIPGAEPWAGILKGIMDTAGGAAGAMGKLKELNLDEKRSQVIKALSELDRPIVVFIDDIDRLPHEDVFQMIRLIKSIADFPRVTFVLTYDTKYLIEALSTFGIEDGSKYLDKIVQVRLHLPHIHPSSLQDLVFTEFNALSFEGLTALFPGDEDRLSTLYHFHIKHLIKSPRDVKQIFNRLRFSEKICRGEVAFSDLVGLETLAIKAPALFEHIRTYPYAYTGHIPDDTLGIEKSGEYVARFKEQRNKTIGCEPEADRRAISGLLSELFPLTKDESNATDPAHWRKYGKVACHDRLILYLTYSIPKTEVSLPSIVNFIESDEKRLELIQVLSEEKKLPRFIELLSDHINTSENLLVNSPEGFLNALAKALEDPHVEEDDYHHLNPFTPDMSRQIKFILKDTIKSISNIQRFAILNSLALNKEYLSLSTSCLRLSLGQHGFYEEDKEVPSSEFWMSNEELEKFVRTWKNSVSEAFADKSICTLRERRLIINNLAKLDEKLAQKLVGPFFENDYGLDNFAKIIGSAGMDSKKGRYASVDDEFLGLLGNVKFIRAQVKNRLKSTPSPSTKLIAIFKNIVDGKKYYLSDASEAENF